MALHAAPGRPSTYSCFREQKGIWFLWQGPLTRPAAAYTPDTLLLLCFYHLETNRISFRTPFSSNCLPLSPFVSRISAA